MVDGDAEEEGLGAYETLLCQPAAQYVAELQLARPKKSNALNSKCWRELPQARWQPAAGQGSRLLI